MQSHPSPSQAPQLSAAVVRIHPSAEGDEETQRFERVAVDTGALDDSLPDTLPASPPPDSAAVAIARGPVRIR